MTAPEMKKELVDVLHELLEELSVKSMAMRNLLMASVVAYKDHLTSDVAFVTTSYEKARAEARAEATALWNEKRKKRGSTLRVGQGREVSRKWMKDKGATESV